ncbi:helix-turn-helix transcriptional regulator [Francisella philomiragia]|uniref:helix-turn-helix transcriptional regulator n=1 Tax=Francisella philomiragia TaxID=28110 RepID=UPI00190315B6|nr:helix-turn-helix transcriptional regulator [Francisella philomiragia]MBK2270207.1 helix-turn-helix transcriptional regulator [Francisella philomiragia]MBK2275871.1 helix-turn-helix transcriptional regulator [Francisella philomiragia]MBK2305084.1 helix-turn-helix transcriptional regulator [Francisella philomiragia]
MSNLEEKVVKEYVYTGMIFPVTLKNVKMVKYSNEWCPIIDDIAIANEWIKKIGESKDRITGNQLKFIRSYFKMSLRQFSEVVNESHTAIAKWEKSGNEVAKMDLNIEKIIKMYICREVMKDTDDKSLMKIFNKILDFRPKNLKVAH